MTTTLADLLAGVDMEGGENFCDSVYNFLKNQGKDINLLTNSGIGVWSQSDTNKGLATLNYDAGSAGGGDVPDVGDAATGAVSGATGKIISYTITGGTFATNNAVGVLTLGAVTGCFQDNETINFTDGETALVNGDANVGVENDPCNNDSTGLWTDDGAGITLAFVAAEYTVTTNAGNQRAWIANAALTAGKIYKIELDIKDGTAAGADIEGYFDDGAAQYGKIETTAAGWASVFWTFECATTTAAGKVGFRIPTSLAASNIEIRRFSCYEITPCCTAADNLAFDGWTRDPGPDLYREHNGANTKDGSFYALAIVPSTAGHDAMSFPNGVAANEEWYMQFQGRPITFGMWVLAYSANHVRIRIQDSVDSTYSDYHTGGGDYEWLEVTKVIDAGATALQFKLTTTLAGDVDGTTIVYVSQVMSIFGWALGEGMYQPRLEEWVIFDNAAGISSAILDGGGFSSVGATGINVEADSDAVVPKGAKGLYIRPRSRDFASQVNNTYLRLDGKISGEFFAYCAGLASDSFSYSVGRISCDIDGDIDYVIAASGADTLDAHMLYMGVQVT